MRIRCHESEMKENRLADERLRRLRCWTPINSGKALAWGFPISMKIFETLCEFLKKILVYLMPLILVKCGRAT